MFDSYPYFSFKHAVIYPLLIWLLFTPFANYLDLTISRYFFEEGQFSLSYFYEAIYHYGIWPLWMTIGFASLGLCYAFWYSNQQMKKICFYLLATLAIGAGLFVHLLLKDQWGRPRPRQLIEFGGNQEFSPYYSPHFNNPYGPSKSFSCGHCSAGFYFFSLAFVGLFIRSKKLFWLGMGLAFILGGALSLTRIAQGGHFLSDTLASMLIMWLSAWILAYFLLFKGQWTHERIDS